MTDTTPPEAPEAQDDQEEPAGAEVLRETPVLCGAGMGLILPLGVAGLTSVGNIQASSVSSAVMSSEGALGTVT